MIAKRYYAGGVRVLIDGIPYRMERKPSAHYLALLREKKTRLDFYGPSEYRLIRVKEAKNAIYNYSKALGISLDEAKARIDAQRLHVLANPVRDLSMEYDL